MKFEWSEEAKGPDSRHKLYNRRHTRWENKAYLNYVRQLPCANCNIEDETIVPHHLKGRFSPLSGGAGVKASDIFTMPLCYDCHRRLHEGDRDVLDWQHLFILQTLDKATQDGIIQV